MNDLTSRAGVAAHMSEATSTSDWDKRANDIKKANHGKFPEFWKEVITYTNVSLEVHLDPDFKQQR